MRCYYEVLQVPQNADDAEIKSAYRKLALKWHPDKNLENTEHAKDQFQLVQQAYEVLSDKHERAWYDNHREQILLGANSEFQDNCLDVFQFFGNCFKGYGDDENGFYTVYRNVFEKIAQEDMEFMEDKEEFCDIPGFGNSQTDYEKVAAFYAYWSNYATKKSYVWLDPHKIQDIRDRRYLKLVEKENKKVRQNAKKERNEEIRNLVAFVKKRDKRVQYQKKLLSEKQLLNKKKREQLTRDKKLQRQQELQNSNVQPEWSKFDNFKTELEELEKTLAEEFGDNLSNSSENDSEDEINSLYCVACNKIFKTPKSFQNHESSKKHKENIELLKTSFLFEEHETLQESDPEETIEEENIFTNSDIEENINKDKGELVNDKNLEVSYDSDSQELQIKCKKKKKQKKIIAHESVKGDNDIYLNRDSEDDSFFSTKKQKKGKRRNNKNNINCNGTIQDSDSIDTHFFESKTPSTVRTKTEEEKEGELSHIGKPRKNKRNKKTKNDYAGTGNDIDINHNCLTCKSVFGSKNKLFDHLKKTGHGVYLDPNFKNKTKQDDNKK